MSEEVSSLVTRERVMLAASGIAAVLAPLWLLSGRTQVWEEPIPIGTTPFHMVSIEQPADALAAPLFNAERKVPVPKDQNENVVDPESPAAPPAPPPSLVGLIVGRGTPGLALLRGADGQTQLLHAGEAIDGWQVSAINATGATIEMNGQQQRIGLAFTKPPSGDAPSKDGSTPAIPAASAEPDQPSPPGQSQ